MLNVLFKVSKQASSTVPNETQMASFSALTTRPLLVLCDIYTEINAQRYHKISPRRMMVFFISPGFSEKKASDTFYVKIQISFFNLQFQKPLVAIKLLLAYSE